MHECEGPGADKKLVEEMLNHPENKCLICGRPVSEGRSSRLISGIFRFCSESEDEFVFSPLEVEEAINSAASIDF
jgi:hypothetical protein